MVDICMCHNSKDCPQASKCFRALAEYSEYQTISDFYNPEKLDCEHYWEIKNTKELKKLNKAWRE